MNKYFIGAAFAAVVVVVGQVFFLSNPAEAACRQVLAPNRWQYITVCDGYRGSSPNYSGAIAAGVVAGAIALEVLPDLLGTVGSVAGIVGDVTSGTVDTFGSTANNVTAPLNSATTINPFNIFGAQNDVPCNENDRRVGCRNMRGNAAAFGTNAGGDEQYVVDMRGCDANRAVRGGCPKRAPQTRCDEHGCHVEYVTVPSAKNKKGKEPQTPSVRDRLKMLLSQQPQ